MDRTTRAVFFDAGYTLLCMEPDQKTIFLRSCADLGIEIDRSRLREGIDRASAMLQPRAPASEKQPYSIAAVDRFWTQYHRVLLSSCAARAQDVERAEDVYRRFVRLLGWRVYDEVRPVLRALRAKGVTLGIISNWTGDLEDVLRSVELRHHFDFVLDSAHLGWEKPHPEIFLEAVRRAQISPHEALHVGDSPDHDVAGALAVGLRAVLVDRYDAHPAFDRAPRMETLEQLLELI
ncbi:MAG: HAD-IA family hydrolase [Candidatus Eremiobacteraeota bacterium]|nr:HAD-IA family hydrolase [Candidatus Eremiobacteraeota bacterium]